MVKPSSRREMAQHSVEHKGVSIRLACIAFTISQTCYRYQAKQSVENIEIANCLVRLTHNQRNWGFGLCFMYLRNVKGYGWNHKRVYRIYRELELNLRIKPRKRIVREKPEPLTVPESINQCWSMPVVRVVRSLNQIIEWRGKPVSIRSDNGPEYISGMLKSWAEQQAIRLDYIQPGNPQQNAYIERYNRTVRYDWLSHYLFESIGEVQNYATQWMWTYNHERSNMALGGITPKQKLALAA